MSIDTDLLHWANEVIRNAEQGRKRPPPQAFEVAELIADGRITTAYLLTTPDDSRRWAWDVLRITEALEIAAVPAGFTRDQARSLYEAEMATRSGKRNHWGPPPDPFMDELLEEVAKPLYCAPDATCGEEGCVNGGEFCYGIGADPLAQLKARDAKRYAHLEAPESLTEPRTGQVPTWSTCFVAAAVGLTGGILVGLRYL